MISLTISIFLIALNAYVKYDKKYMLPYNILVKLLTLLIIGKIAVAIIPDTIYITHNLAIDLKLCIDILLTTCAFLSLYKNHID